MANTLDPDETWRFIGLDLCLNCLFAEVNSRRHLQTKWQRLNGNDHDDNI